MNYTQLQLLLQNDELHYITDSTEFFKDNDMKLDDNMDILLNHTFILFENTINDYNETIEILNNNNIKYTIKTDSLNLDYILYNNIL
jgi:hypothetical protein